MSAGRKVLIVGAGASKEFGLPTGAELTAKIREILKFQYDDFGGFSGGNRALFNALEHLSVRQQFNLTAAVMLIRDNMLLAPSIDNFLHTHKDNPGVVAVGKASICEVIQNFEVNSRLRGNGPLLNLKAIQSKDDPWLAKLFRILVAQKDFESFLKALRTITFINFNYDRCIQQFFHRASTHYFALSDQQEAQLREALDVIHPYGNIGEIDESLGRPHGFSRVAEGDYLLQRAERIRTFTEGTTPALTEAIRSKIRRADLVAFLGFGFLPLNMEFLFGGEDFSAIHVVGTCMGKSEESIQQIARELENVFVMRQWMQLDKKYERIALRDCDCSTLFDIFERHFLSAFGQLDAEYKPFR